MRIRASRVSSLLRHFALHKLLMPAAALLLSSSLAIAQLATGTVAGAVTDQSGAAIPGANVVAKNVDTGASRSTVSGPTGRYEFPGLPGGTYEVTATSSGFQTSVRADVVLSVGQNAVVNHTLQIGEVTQSVTVSGEVPLVETTSATVSQLVDEKSVEDMPLRGRDLTQLAILQPGVLKVPAGTGAFSGLGDKITVAGARGNQNLYLLDGVSNSDLSGNPQGASGAYLGADTVKEFQVITNNYSAEYQSAAGAIVSAVTKSGTNSLHGSGFWTTRNSRMDANSWTNNRNNAPKRDFSRNQFGGSLGGPVIRDKTFFFGSYEGFRERTKDNDIVNTWTDATRAGIIPASEGATGGQQVTVDPNIRAIMDLYPRPNTPYEFAGDASFAPTSRVFNTGIVELLGEGILRDPVNDDFVGAKFDHQFANEKLGFYSATYNWDDSDTINYNMMNELGRFTGGNSGLLSRKHTIGNKLTSVLSASLVNEANFGYSYSQAAQDLPNTTHDFSSLASLGGRTYLADINAPAATSIGFRVLGSIYDQTAYQIKDGLSLSRGNHSYRMGTEIKLFRYKQVSCSRGCNGVWGWSNITNWLQNVPNTLEIFQPGHDNPDRLMRQLLFGGYVQDNWQVASSFTLNLGLRYEFTTVPKDDNNLTAALIDFNDPAVTVTEEVKNDPRYAKDAKMPGTIDKFFENPTLKSFSPRLGFAWAPGSRSLSIRGGAGIFYEYPLLFNIRTVLQESPPFVLTGAVNTTSPAYLAFVAAGNPALKLQPGVGSNPIYAPLLASTPNIRAMEFNLKNVTIYRWSFTLQQDMGSGMVVSAGYTGSRGVHLWHQSSANVNRWVGWPNQPPAGTLKTFPMTNRSGNTNACPAAAASLPACVAQPAGAYNPNFGVDMRIQSSNADSTFHGLAVGFQKRMSQGLQLQVAYNYSKSIDSGSGVTSSGENFAQGQRGVWYWDMEMKRGPSQFDIRNAVTTNFTWELPGQSLTGASGALLGGWQVSGILTLTDGHPLSVFSSTTIQNNAIGQSGEQNRANLIPGGDNNAVLDDATAFRYTDPNQFIPSFCTAVPARLGSINAAYNNGVNSVPVCAPGDVEYQPGHFGNGGRNTLTSPGLVTLDFSVQKSFRITEGHSAQFRAEFFNFTNRVNLNDGIANSYSNIGIPVQAVWDTARGEGQITSAGQPRTIQLGLKYVF